MKIYLRRVFKYTFDNRSFHKIMPGTYEVPRQVDKDAAELALEFGAAVIVPEPKVVKKKPVKKRIAKKAPENKVRKGKESK